MDLQCWTFGRAAGISFDVLDGSEVWRCKGRWVSQQGRILTFMLQMDRCRVLHLLQNFRLRFWLKPLRSASLCNNLVVGVSRESSVDTVSCNLAMHLISGRKLPLFLSRLEVHKMQTLEFIVSWLIARRSLARPTTYHFFSCSAANISPTVHSSILEASS